MREYPTPGHQRPQRSAPPIGVLHCSGTPYEKQAWMRSRQEFLRSLEPEERQVYLRRRRKMMKFPTYLS